MYKICVNGKIREATPEEIAEMERLADEFSPPEPDPTEVRIAALEEQLKAAKILLGVE